MSDDDDWRHSFNDSDPPDLLQEEPKFLLISVRESGLCVFSKTFHTGQSMNVEMDLISGFLTALNSFIQEVFAVAGSIERVQHHAYTLLLKSMGPFMVCYACTGEPSDVAWKKLERVTEVLQVSSTAWQTLLTARKTGCLVATGEGGVNKLVTEIFTPQRNGNPLSSDQFSFGDSHLCYAELKERHFELRQ